MTEDWDAAAAKRIADGTSTCRPLHAAGADLPLQGREAVSAMSDALLRLARALLVAWDGMPGCESSCDYPPFDQMERCEVCKLRDRILAIVEGRDG